MSGSIVYIIIAIYLLTAVIVFFATRLFSIRKLQKVKEEHSSELSNQQIVISNLGLEKSQLTTSLQHISEQLEKIEIEKESLESLNNSNHENAVRGENEIVHLQKQLQEQKKDMLMLQEKFKHDFENLAQKILEEKSRKFTEENKVNIQQILQPLDLKINEFKKKVEDSYNQEAKERHSLQKEIIRLAEMNHLLSKEADNLAKALKGDVKQQGSWGEMILEKVLDNSGLTEGIEYEREATTFTEDGVSIRPDVVVKLPDNKHIIIDSKFPLKAYNDYISTDDEIQKAVFLKKHINAVQLHIKLLGDKKYHSATDKNTPDFVMMFLPVEPAFSLAISGADNLFSYAWERKIVLVSPTTLLATLKTVESLWRHEKQTKNALEIAREGGKLYDKFVGFLEDLNKIEKSINNLDLNFKAAKNKLKDGRGSLITKAEQLKQLGIKSEKKLPPQYQISDD